MKVILCLIAATSLLHIPAAGQASESTEDWPAWQKISAGSLSAVSLLATLAGLGASNADSDGGGGSESDGSEGSSDNEQKMQGYAEELKDELLAVVAHSAELIVAGATDDHALASIEEDYPLLANYYRDLIQNHHLVIEAVNDKIVGPTIVHRLNDLMLIHFFDEKNNRVSE